MYASLPTMMPLATLVDTHALLVIEREILRQSRTDIHPVEYKYSLCHPIQHSHNLSTRTFASDQAGSWLLLDPVTFIALSIELL